MTYPYSIVLLVEAPMKEEAEAFGAFLGHSGEEYTVPLSSSGAAPASHYGLHCWGRQPFVDILEGAVPAGFDPDAFAALRAAMVVSIRNENLDHFDEVLTAQGLVRLTA